MSRWQRAEQSVCGQILKRISSWLVREKKDQWGCLVSAPDQRNLGKIRLCITGTTQVSKMMLPDRTRHELCTI